MLFSVVTRHELLGYLILLKLIESRW